MPSLSSSNSLVTSKNRIPSILIEEEFASGTGGFTFIATTGSNDSGTLKTIASGDSTPHYAYKILVCSEYTTYKYSIDLAVSGIGGGHINVGTSVGASDVINVDAASAATYTGTFTTGGWTVIVLHLVGDNNSVTTKWDNVLIQEDN